MNFINENILSLIVFTPAILAFFCLVFGEKQAKILALFASVLTFILSLHIVFHESADGFLNLVSWVPSLGIQYKVAVDGFSLWLIILTTLLMLLSVVFSMGSIQKREKEYYFFLLLLESGMLGAFVALDVFLFYLFWEAMLIPMYFLIGIWGGKERIYASLKFFIYTLIGSVLMLIAILYLYFQVKAQLGVYTFELSQWLEISLSTKEQLWLFGAFAFSFAIKVPMFPVHTWLPDAHVQAPTSGSVILAGVLLKMGTYGFIRFAMPLFPEAVFEFRYLIAGLAVIGIVYGALVAMVQSDIKKLVAYSSISHLGFIMLGLMALTPQAIDGALYQMLNHGVSTGALFLLVGMIYDRTHTREIRDYGGIAKQVPIFTVIFLIVTFSSIALPGTNGFIGEFLILMGSFKTLPLFTVFAASGVILSAVYMLWMVERVFFGPMKHDKLTQLKDLNMREVALLLPLIALIFWMGIKPAYFLNKFERETTQLIERVQMSKPLVQLSLETK